MALSPGTRIGPYEIGPPLGAGGMGEVYRAHDTNLGRDVAIKVLPDALAADPERLARFEREARVLAQLNHPNIATIHGLERAGTAVCLVMELVPGETLAARVVRGRLSVDDAIPIAVQMACALEAAHEKGVVHRDLKPANIIVAPDGRVKVLDFGLAKALAAEEVDDRGVRLQPDLTHSPTAYAGTMAGVILGTAAYMSPEQARGKPVDKRADIWAFGCVLFEMLAGSPAFGGETLTDIVAAVVKNEPDWARLPLDLPPAVQSLLRRCLQKDPARRLHDMADARIELEDESGHDSADAASTPRAAFPRSISWLPAVGIAAAIVIAGFLISRSLQNRSAPPNSSVKRFVIAMPSGALISDVTLSADGEQLVYVLGSDRSQLGGGDRSQLYLRRLDQFDARPIAGTGGATYPFFSPDGRWVGFFADGKIKKVNVGGGTPVVVCEARGVALGASWTDDDAIVFSPDIASGLMQVPAAGGEPKPLTTPSREGNEIGHFWPAALPGGRGVVFNVVTTEGIHMAVLPHNAAQWRRLAPGRRPRFVPTGHLLFTQVDALFAAAFDLERLELTGAPVPIVEGLGNDLLFGQPLVPFAVSATGTLTYVPNSVGRMQLIWVDRTGHATPLRDETAYEYAYPRLSPDGRRLAVGSENQVWIYDLQRGTRSRLTSGGLTFVPAWSADGTRVAFGSYAPGSVDILSRPADLSRPPSMLLGGVNRRYPAGWSSDQRLLFQEASLATGNDIRLLSEPGHSLSDLAATPADERSARLSPDGEWTAYASNETGRFEVYVRTVGRPGGAIPISTSGGGDPVWSRDGRELFYLEGNDLMAVTVRTQPAFEASTPLKLFSGNFNARNLAGADYDVTPDGRRFVMVAHTQPDRPMQINLVTNWWEELKRLAPSK